MSGSSRKTDFGAVKTFFEKNSSVECVRFQWVDYGGLVRTRLTSVRQALRLAESNSSIGVASPLVDAFLIDGSFNVVEEGSKDDMWPDWSSLVLCHYQPNHAAVMCCVEEAGKGFAACPRSLLKKVLKEAEDRQLSFLVGTEVEFYLMPSPDSTAPVDDIMPYCSTASLRKPHSIVIEEAVQAIEAAGIRVWTYHSELVAGLYEISTEPMTPLHLADAMVYMHEAIKTVAFKHGLHATMHPKPFDKTHGVGAHMHISLSTDKKADSFLAGVLDSVPGISAIAQPNYDSYLRADFSGGAWVCWATEDRTVSVRKIRPAYWEFRFVDGTTNIYLTLATILGVGLNAWEKGVELKMKPKPRRMFQFTEEERKDLGIEKPVPKGLSEAIAALREDKQIAEVLGQDVVERFANHRSKEEGIWGALTLQERRAMNIKVF